MKHNIVVLLIFFFLNCSFGFCQWTPETVPDPRARDFTYVSNPDLVLTEGDVSTLNVLLQDIEDKTGVQYAIVVLNSIDYSYDAFTFAFDLFQLWGIGEKDKDNGLLLLIIIDSRDWRFITGYGIEAVLTDALLKNIGENILVPHFREYNYGTGLIETTKKISEILTSEDSEYLRSYYSNFQSWWDNWILWMWILWGLFFLNGLVFLVRRKNVKPLAQVKVFSVKIQKESHAEIIPEKKHKMLVWGKDVGGKFTTVYLLSAIIPGASMYYDDFFSNPAKNSFIGMYVFFMIMAIIYQMKLDKNAYSLSKNSTEQFFNLWSANRNIGVRVFFFPMPFIFFYIFHKIRMRKLKSSDAHCPICKTSAKLMPSDQQTQLLSKVKLFEKKIHSIDHRVFQCLNLHTVEIPFPGRRYGAFSDCDSCSARAVRQTGNKTIRAATYTSTGTGQRTYTCKQCGNKTYTTYTIPVKQRSSSGSGSGSSGGGGGSWGGGSSGGGGAGGSW